MKFLRNNLKVVIAFILGLILAGGIVYAATVAANEIDYTTAKNSSVKNVEQALNDLYANRDAGNPNSVTLVENYDYAHPSINFSVGDYKYFILTNAEWATSKKIYSSMIEVLAISSIENATYIVSGLTGRNGSSSSVAARSYVIIPDGSGEDISITFNGSSDSTSIYGVK